MLAQLACILEATARKPGNVHPARAFDDAHYLDFVVGAAALGRHLTPDRIGRLGLGGAILAAVEDSVRLVGHNANLGMILLLAPLAAAEDTLPRRHPFPPGDKPDRGVRGAEALRLAVGGVLERTTIDDANSVFEAIRHARPGGLGSAPDQDVARTPTVTLTGAMCLASDRDAIARQYATNYDDVFEIGLPALGDALRAGRPLETAIIGAHLSLMARCPDTLIARKRGIAVAEESARRAAVVLGSGWPDGPGAADALDSLDEWLRADGHARNPGATADLVAATLFVALRVGAIELPRHLNRAGWDGVDLPR